VVDHVEEGRGSAGQGAGESQDGVTCRYRATESRPPMARETGNDLLSTGKGETVR
jgi:hypothetical protein